jgi:hypothetical protein
MRDMYKILHTIKLTTLRGTKVYRRGSTSNKDATIRKSKRNKVRQNIVLVKVPQLPYTAGLVEEAEAIVS